MVLSAGEYNLPLNRLYYARTCTFSTCSEHTVKRRRRDLGLFGSARASSELSSVAKSQLVLDALSKDPHQQRGPRTIKHNIAQCTGVHLSR
jgi:hypothetical protein